MLRGRESSKGCGWGRSAAAGSAGGGALCGWRQRPTPAVLILSDQVRGAAVDGQGGRGAGGPHVERGLLSLAGTPLHHHPTLCSQRRLRARSLGVNEPVLTEGVAGLRPTGFGAEYASSS